VDVDQWQQVSESQWVAPAGYMRLLTRRYVLPDGRFGDWDLLDGGRTVAVLALTEDHRVVLARQFRPGPGRTLDEMPGGAVESGEDVAEAAARELLEETGYAGAVEVLAQTWLASTATTQRFVAVARGCTRVADPTPDASEFVEPILVSLEEFRRTLRAGALTDVDLGYLALDHLRLL
jgi:ADP-ribose diphosphatase